MAFSGLSISSSPDSVRPPTLTSSSTSSSGEYNAFTFVGGLISGGGSRRGLWILPSNAEASKTCLGQVGSTKFCTMVLEGSASSCGVMRHGTNKFDVTPGVVYIRCNDIQAFCAPNLDLKNFTDKEGEALLSAAATAADWESTLVALGKGERPDWLQLPEPSEERGGLDKVPSLSLTSPRISDSKAGIFAVLPSLSFESDASTATGSVNALLELNPGTDLAKRISKIESRLAQIKVAWPKPFADLEASFLGVVSDIKTLETRTLELCRGVGSTNENSLPLATHLRNLESSLKNFEVSLSQLNQDWETTLQGEMGAVEHQLQDLHQRVQTFEEAIQNQSTTLDIHERRFTHIKPIITNLKAHRGTAAGPDLSPLLTRLEELEAKLQRQNPTSNTAPPADIQQRLDQLEVTLRDQAHTISLLENRVVGAGVKMGDLVFQSFEDLLLWVKVKLPSGRFGFVVDGHSFLEFFTLSLHVDSESSAAAEHNAEKAGYATYYEMKVAASFNNLFPLLFGKASSAGMDDSDSLPGVISGEKWNNGSTGLHHQIMRKMNDVSYQLDANIKQVYRNHTEARQLAIDCVTASKRFVIDLVAFISQEYSTWQTRGFTKKEAWKVVCQIVCRLFEDLESARVSARHVRDKGNIDYTSASIIFATLKCHEVMASYVQHQFQEHPAVSSVITRHLAMHFVKPEPTNDRIGKVEAKVSAYMSKLDTLVQTKQKN
jgi:hypothetical protein